MDLAQGASMFQAATNVLKDTALDKLLGPTAVFAGGLIGIFKLIRNIVRESGILEKGLLRMSRIQQVQGKFETLLKSAELAKKRIEDLYKFTKNSPFKFDDVAEANRILEALTRGAFSGSRAMQMVGDVAAATGQSMSEAGEKIGKMYNAIASGRSIDRIAFQMQFAGVATDELISKLERLEAEGAGVNQMWTAVESVLNRTSGGMTNAKSMDDYKTKLAQAEELMQQAFGQHFVDAQVKATITATDALKNLTPVIGQIGKDLSLVSNFFVEIKTKITDFLLATKGAASVLQGLWEALKVGLVSLSALTAINFTKGIFSIGNFANGLRKTTRNLLEAEDATLRLAKAQRALRGASRLGERGNYIGAARLGARGAWGKARVYTRVAHVASAQAVGNKAGLAKAANYALAMSTQAVAGGLKLAGRAAWFFTKQIGAMAGAVLLNPLFLLVTGITAVVSAWRTLSQANEEAKKSLDDTKKAIEALNSQLDKTRAAARTTDDWAAAMHKLTEEIANAEAALDSFNEEQRSKGAWDYAVSLLSGAEKKDRERKTLLEAQPQTLRDKRKDLLKDLPTLGMGTKEAEAYARELRTLAQLSDEAFNNKMSIADDVAAIKLLDAEIQRLNADIEAGTKIRDAYEKFNRDEAHQTLVADYADKQQSTAHAEQQAIKAGLTKDQLDNLEATQREFKERRVQAKFAGGLSEKEDIALANHEGAAYDVKDARRREAELKDQIEDKRRNSDSKLVQLEQEITDTEAGLKKRPDDADLKQKLQDKQKERLKLSFLAETVDANRSKVLGNTAEVQRRQDTSEISTEETEQDQKIIKAIKTGRNSKIEQAKYEKELAILDAQINQAIRNKLPQLQSQLQEKKKQLVAEKTLADAQFKRDKEWERNRNQKLISGNRRGAKVMDDAKELAEMIDQYQSHGLSEKQAREDFRLQKLAEAPQPSVIADSKQSIGGGGGFSQTDPQLAILDRQLETQREANKYLEGIHKYITEGGKNNMLP